MLRTISNWFSGRKKTLIESMEYDDVCKLFSGINKNICFELNGTLGDNTVSFHNLEAKDISGFIKEHFKPFPGISYFKGNHEIYSGKQNDRHYLDLYKGAILDKIGKQEILSSPCKKVTIDFILENTKCYK